MGRLVHTSLGSSYLIAHVLHYPPPSSNKHTHLHPNSFVIGTAVINKLQTKTKAFELRSAAGTTIEGKFAHIGNKTKN
jgi:hypothetical protein